MNKSEMEDNGTTSIKAETEEEQLALLERRVVSDWASAMGYNLILEDPPRRRIRLLA